MMTGSPGRRSRPVVRVEGGRKVLRVAGVIQSVEAPGRDRPDLWDALVPRMRGVRRALVLGLGGGTVASVLLRRFPSVAITAVDDDARMLDIARRDFGLGQREQVRMEVADAFAFVEREAGPYELISVDLFRGARMPPRVLSERFLGHLRRLAAAGGMVTFNFAHTSDIARRVRRLDRVLPVRALVEIGGNVVAHCAPDGAGGRPPRAPLGPAGRVAPGLRGAPAAPPRGRRGARAPAEPRSRGRAPSSC
jgi:spermidine synthase